MKWHPFFILKLKGEVAFLKRVRRTLRHLLRHYDRIQGNRWELAKPAKPAHGL